MIVCVGVGRGRRGAAHPAAELEHSVHEMCGTSACACLGLREDHAALLPPEDVDAAQLGLRSGALDVARSGRLVGASAARLAAAAAGQLQQQQPQQQRGAPLWPALAPAFECASPLPGVAAGRTPTLLETLMDGLMLMAAPKNRTSHRRKRIRQAGQIATRGPHLQPHINLCPVCERMRKCTWCASVRTAKPILNTAGSECEMMTVAER